MHNVAMVLTKITTVTSTAVLAAIAETGIDPLGTGKALGGFSTSEILGVVAVVSIIAMVVLYRDSRKDNARLFQIIEANTKSNQLLADTVQENNAVMIEVKDAIIKCKNNAHGPQQ